MESQRHSDGLAELHHNALHSRDEAQADAATAQKARLESEAVAAAAKEEVRPLMVARTLDFGYKSDAMLSLS